MTDLEIHGALLAAAARATDCSAVDRAAVLEELGRHKVGCRPAPWRECPVVAYYATIYGIDLEAARVIGQRGPGVRIKPGR